jgi:hypothetical protein
LVISFFPVRGTAPLLRAKCAAEPTPPTDQEEKIEEDEPKETPGASSLSLEEHWGLSFAYGNRKEESGNALRTLDLDLPASISWHSTLCFDELELPWRVIYSAEGRPVIIERQYGRGTIVLCGDSYYLSNEALFKERHPKLLTWLVGKNAQVVFDESHLGIQENPGVAALARKYRLHGFFVGILLLAGLFVWKNSVCFVPPRRDDTDTEENDPASNRDATEGLVSLIRRHIPAREILGVCFREWKKSFAPGKAIPGDKLERIKSVIGGGVSHPGKHGDPVGGYQTISEILSERKKP